MSLSERANRARGRYARVHRAVDLAFWAVEVGLIFLVVWAAGRLLGWW